MSKKKKSAPLFAVISDETALAAAANRYVALSIEIKRLTAEHEAKIAALNAEFDTVLQPLAAEANGLAASVQLFAEQRTDLFPESAEDGPRSRTYLNAVIGFRTNPPKVTKRVGNDTEAAIVERLEALPWGEKYVKYASPGLDKDALLKDRATLTESQLAQAGIRIVQGQTFFIDPVLETAEPVRIAA